MQWWDVDSGILTITFIRNTWKNVLHNFQQLSEQLRNFSFHVFVCFTCFMCRWKQAFFSPLLTCVGCLCVKSLKPTFYWLSLCKAILLMFLSGVVVWKLVQIGGQTAEWQQEKAHVMFVWRLLCHKPHPLLCLFLPSSWPYLAPRRVTQRSGWARYTAAHTYSGNTGADRHTYTCIKIVIAW